MIESNRNSEFLVTDLSLEETIAALDGFDFTKFIPNNAVILNCGSGIYRTFEKDLLKKTPNLFIVSIDPSLGVVTINNDGSITTQGYQIYVNVPNGVAYEPINESDSPDIIRGQEAIEFDTKRKKVLTQIPGAVAADGVKLPFKDQSFDFILDVRGAMLYLKEDYQVQMGYISEMKRTLKNTGLILSIFLISIQKNILSDLNMNFTRHTKWAYIITK